MKQKITRTKKGAKPRGLFAVQHETKRGQTNWQYEDE